MRNDPMFYVRVPNPLLADCFSREVTRVTKPAGTFDEQHPPHPAFGWTTVGSGLCTMTYIEIDHTQRVLIHPQADASRLRRVIEDVTAKELSACMVGRRGPQFRDPAAHLRTPPALTSDYFLINAGKEVSPSDFIAPFINSYSCRRDVLDQQQYWTGDERYNG